jgi:hypothetical protein
VPIFQHEGPIDHDVVQNALKLAEAASLDANDAVSVRKRLFNVLVEGLENVHNHAVNGHKASAFALLTRTHDAYRLAMGNSMPVATAALMSHRIDVLNAMDDHDLKEHYMKMLGNESRTERGGAGLGLLTIARKSQRPIVVRTAQLNGDSVYFVQELVIPR